MEKTPNELADPSVAALVAALHIFAARGRAIQEERAKQHNLDVTQNDFSPFARADLEQVITPPESLVQGGPGG